MMLVLFYTWKIQNLGWMVPVWTHDRGGGALWYTYSTCQTLRLGRFFSGRLTKVDGRVVHSDHAAFREVALAYLACWQDKRGKFGRGSGPRGGTLIFSHICRLGLFFWGSKFWISIFLGVFRKMNIIGGFEDFVDIFWGHHKIGLVWGSFLCILGSFFKVK